MKWYPCLILVFLLCYSVEGFNQSAYIRQNSYINHLVDRLDIKSTLINNYLFTSQKPYRKNDIVTMALVLQTEPMKFTSKDRLQHSFIFKNCNIWTEQGLRDNKKPILKHFYILKTDFYEKTSEDFSLRINPVLNFSYGSENNNNVNLFKNTRGFEVEALLFEKIGLYTKFTDNQRRFPSFVSEYIQHLEAVPGIAGYKTFKDDFGLDYFDFEAYFDIPIYKKLHFQFGHGKQFIGNGYRSLILSNESAPRLFGNLTAKLGKFSYQNIWSRLTKQYGINEGTQLIDHKYQAFHHLSYNVNKSLNIGLFESIIFSRDNGYDINYLNPFIVYKAVEWYLGSPDNALLGADFKYNIIKKYQLYGQLVLDEFKVDKLFNNSGWWANKFAFQIGAKAIDIINISTLDLQLEYNVIRPYMYSYNNDTLTYTHYNQALAHPLGSNFKELVGIVRYEPKKNWQIENTFMHVKQGISPENENVGENIFANNLTRNQEFNNTITQGILKTTFLNSLRISYSFWHNAFIDLNYIYRKSKFDGESEQVNYIGINLRLNDVFKHFTY